LEKAVDRKRCRNGKAEEKFSGSRKAVSDSNSGKKKKKQF
jgi:hypothetical protein